jgi:hypothetical protein
VLEGKAKQGDFDGGVCCGTVEQQAEGNYRFPRAITNALLMELACATE